MNLNEFQKSGVGTINLTDSLKAPLLGLKIELNENSSIPQTNDLIVYVSKGEDIIYSQNRHIKGNLVLEGIFSQSYKVLENRGKRGRNSCYFSENLIK